MFLKNNGCMLPLQQKRKELVRPPINFIIYKEIYIEKCIYLLLFNLDSMSRVLDEIDYIVWLDFVKEKISIFLILE
jgi:hypothetical protein